MPNRSVFFVSDSTGITAETFGNAILTQFEGRSRHVRRPFVDTVDKARAVFESLGKVLAHCGATPRDVVKVTTYLVDSADAKVVTPIRLAFFDGHRPPHTGVVIKALGSPEVRLEVEAIAVARRGA